MFPLEVTISLSCNFGRAAGLTWRLEPLGNRFKCPISSHKPLVASSAPYTILEGRREFGEGKLPSSCASHDSLWAQSLSKCNHTIWGNFLIHLQKLGNRGLSVNLINDAEIHVGRVVDAWRSDECQRTSSFSLDEGKQYIGVKAFNKITLYYMKKIITLKGVAF